MSFTTLTARALRYAAIAASLWYLGVYVTVALVRLRYPFELEWMEGGAVDHVVRVLHHQALYVAPQIAFIPFEYPPLYFYVSALVAKIVGIGFFPLRLVSFVASIVCFACIFHIVKTETRRVFPAVIAAGLFAATFRISGAWFDLARVDSLFMALFLLAVPILRRATSARAHLVAGVLLALSFLTKQTALAMALPTVVYLLVVRRRAGLWLAGSLLAIVAASSLLLHVASDGWFTTYVWQYPFKHVWAQEIWVGFWTRDLLAHLPIAFACVVFFVTWQILGFRQEAPFWPVLFVALIGAAYRSRLQTGGYDNVLMPAYAIIAILSGLAIGRLADAMEPRSVVTRRLVEMAVSLACLVQLALLGYDPTAQVPRAADRAAGEQLQRVIADLPGDVLVPYHGYLTTRAGKPLHAHLMQVHDIVKFGDARSAALAGQFRVAIRQAAFGAIVLDDPVNYYFMADVDAAYERQSKVFADPGVFFQVTGGFISRPEYVYVPKARIAQR